SRGVVLKIGAIGVALAVGSSVGSWLLMSVAGGWQRLEAVALQTMSPAEYTDLLVWGPGGGVLPTSSPWWLAVTTPHSATPFDLAFTIGTSLAVLSVSVLLGRVAGRLVVPLAAAGSMTLTLYAGHLLLTSLPPQPASDVLTFVIQLLLVVIFALLWGRRYARGPLEAGVAVVTRGVRDLMLATPGAHAGPRTGGRRQESPVGAAAGGLALVHRGPAAAPGCPEAVADLLRRSRWGLDVTYVGPREPLALGPDALARAVLYAQPGGGQLRPAYRRLRRHARVIRAFVRGGGRYLGFCLGGYLAGRSPGFALLPGDTDQYIA